MALQWKQSVASALIHPINLMDLCVSGLLHVLQPSLSPLRINLHCFKVPGLKVSLTNHRSEEGIEYIDVFCVLYD